MSCSRFIFFHTEDTIEESSYSNPWIKDVCVAVIGDVFSDATQYHLWCKNLYWTYEAGMSYENQGFRLVVPFSEANG